MNPLVTLSAAWYRTVPMPDMPIEALLMMTLGTWFLGALWGLYLAAKHNDMTFREVAFNGGETR